MRHSKKKKKPRSKNKKIAKKKKKKVKFKDDNQEAFSVPDIDNQFEYRKNGRSKTYDKSTKRMVHIKRRENGKYGLSATPTMTAIKAKKSKHFRSQSSHRNGFKLDNMP